MHLHPKQADFETLKSEVAEQLLRVCIGEAADDGQWFKRKDKGEALGNLLARYLDRMQDTATAATLREIEDWCYER